jgi:GMP synthase-like glutamine amidotransferase
MKPIRIFRHVACEGPGYLGTFLDRHAIPYEVVCIDQGIPVPHDLRKVSGLVFMGGAMSVNDPLDWVAAELELIREAHVKDVPVMGICLGAQLLSKALGGQVTRGASMEIGWHPVEIRDGCDGSDWLCGLPKRFVAFHWHGETFTSPKGSIHLLGSSCFPNQAFAIGKTLATQFHLEMSENMVQQWIRLYGTDLARPSRCVQDAQTITENLERKLHELHRISDLLYGRWVTHLERE